MKPDVVNCEMLVNNETLPDAPGVVCVSVSVFGPFEVATAALNVIFEFADPAL